jgi:hypothetical protein
MIFLGLSLNDFCRDGCGLNAVNYAMLQKLVQKTWQNSGSVITPHDGAWIFDHFTEFGLVVGLMTGVNPANMSLACQLYQRQIWRCSVQTRCENMPHCPIVKM